MSGHSKWAQIKHQKGIADQKRGQLFSKLLNAITIAARQDPRIEFNARLRTAVLKAKENNVPQENIDRAIKKVSETKNLEELLLEAYGPQGTAILIEAISDSKNRTISEIKKILNENDAKWAESGSVRWAFENKGGNWIAKFPQEIKEEDAIQLKKLISDLENHSDVQKVIINAKI